MRAEKVVELFFSEDECEKINSIEERFGEFANDLRANPNGEDINLCTDAFIDTSSVEISQEEYNLEDLLTAIEDRLALLSWYIKKNKGAE